MNNSILDQFRNYNCNTQDEYINAWKEIVQEIILYALSTTDFFDYAAFYGGTALRIFYNLPRFSEDLDFSLISKENSFDLTKYLSSINRIFKSFGLSFESQIKSKTNDSNIQSAFLKGNTLEHILMVCPPKEVINHIHKDAIIKIKFEIDTNPPDLANYAFKTIDFPQFSKIRLFDESSLYAGKLHAVLCRNWKNRIKGRDLYDLLFYIKHGSLFNIAHLQKRLEDSNKWDSCKILTLKDVKDLLESRLKKINYDDAKKDVIPFVKNVDELNCWSESYFLKYINYIRCDLLYIFEEEFNIKFTFGVTINKQNVLYKKQINNIKDYNILIDRLDKKYFNSFVSDDDIIFNNKTCTKNYLTIRFNDNVKYIEINSELGRLIKDNKFNFL